MKFLSSLLFLCFSLFGVTQEQAALLSLLSQREPNHRAETNEYYPDRTSKVVTFYAPTSNGKEIPVKKIEFNQDRSIKYEMDLCEVDSKSKASEIWNSTVVPHGVRVDFYRSV